jgi:type I restriction enzyme S subunit
MAVRGAGSTGKIGIVSTKLLAGANISPNLIRMKVNAKQINPLYMYYLLSSKEGQQLVNQKITRTAKKAITAAELKTIELPIAPLQLQLAFARIAELILRITEKQANFTNELNRLHSSLTNRNFGNSNNVPSSGI